MRVKSEGGTRGGGLVMSKWMVGVEYVLKLLARSDTCCLYTDCPRNRRCYSNCCNKCGLFYSHQFLTKDGHFVKQVIKIFPCLQDIFIGVNHFSVISGA